MDGGQFPWKKALRKLEWPLTQINIHMPTTHDDRTHGRISVTDNVPAAGRNSTLKRIGICRLPGIDY